MSHTVMGVCSWTLGINDIDDLMHTVAELGLSGIQYCEPLDAHCPEKVKQAAEREGLEIIINDPFDCRPGEKHGEATFDNAMAFYRRAIDFAAQLGCGQTLQGLSGWTQKCETPQSAWEFLVRGVKTLADYAQEKGVPLAYEPCNLYEVPFIHTADEFQALVDEAGVTNVAMLLDSFHMNIGEKAPLHTLRKYAASNAIFHVSNSNREGIGSGHIDFLAYHQALCDSGFNGPVVLECVLAGNPVNTPPRNNEEMQRLKTMLKRSAAIWRQYDEH